MKTLSAKFLSGVLGALIAIGVLFSSCKKDTTDIGLGLLDDQLQGAFTDTLTVITHTKRMDSLKTGLPSALLCGNYYDPIFGITNASFYSEVYPQNTGSNVTFGASPSIDSIVLSISYRSYYGKPAPLNFRVYQMTERIYKDSTYYSNSYKTYNSIFPLANVTLEPNTMDSVHADGTTYPPQLRITLDKSLLTGLLNTSIYATLDDFRNVFNGIHVAAYQTGLSGNRAIYSFNASDAHSKITMYYHDLAAPATQLTFSYLMGGQTGRFNRYDHDYSIASPSILTQINSATDTTQQGTVYVQGLAGLQTKIYFPYLTSIWKNGPVAINKAELIVKADPSTIDSYFTTPSQLVLVALDSAEAYQSTPDMLEGGAFSGGLYDATNKEYVFNVARYLQQVLTGKIKDHGMMIIPAGGAVFPNRVVLGGGASSSAYRIRLKLTYTKL